MNKVEKFNLEKFKKETKNLNLESDKIIFEEYYFSKTQNYFLGKQIIENNKYKLYSILITEKHKNEKMTWTNTVITENFLNALKKL